MQEAYYLGVYWSNRKEAAADCARRALALLQSLRVMDSAFERWFRRGKTREEALGREIPIDEETLVGLFERGRNRRDTDRTVIEDLGYRISLWNGGDDDESATLTMRCGSHASTPRVWVPNSCLIDLPSSGAAFERLLNVPALLTLMEAVVKSLQPDWGLVGSDQHRDVMPRPEPGVPLVGWITYLSVAQGKPPVLPAQVKVVPIGPYGSAIVGTEERFTASNAKHVKTTDEVRTVLDRAGLLRRIA